jgi:hypothetical protein
MKFALTCAILLLVTETVQGSSASKTRRRQLQQIELK